MEQQLKDNLYRKTLTMMNVFTPEQRQRSMHHFMEGLPLTSGDFFRYDGSKCLVGSGYEGFEDYRAALWTLDEASILARSYAISAFDTTVTMLGLDVARSVVIQAMKAWLAASKDDVFPPLVKELVAV